MSKEKIFRDTVHNYISVDNIYVKHLIDTFEMQRLKDVSQMGIKPLFSNANHNRFSHSLGVYHIGTKIFSSLKTEIEKILKSTCIEKITNYKEIINNFNKEIYDFEICFNIACLLHDIGHSSYSHTFEYLYRNQLLDLSGGKINCKKDFVNELQRIEKTARRNFPRYENNRELFLLRERVCYLIGEKYTEDAIISNTPHELMGAYQILTDSSIKKKIVTCIICKKENTEEISCELRKKDLQQYNEHLIFIARMITGALYNTDDCEDTGSSLEFSIKNCIIKLLNGKVDADSIDYLNRNAYISGYDSFHIDTERLCRSFSAFLKKDNNDNYIIESCFKKMALSALNGFIAARNYEPQWLYCHHKLVFYGDYLMKYLYKRCNRFICEELLDLYSNDGKIIKEKNGECYFIKEQENSPGSSPFIKVSKRIIKNAFMVNGLAPIHEIYTKSHCFFKTTDSDINEVFKSFYFKYRKKEFKDLTEWEKNALEFSLDNIKVIKKDFESECKNEFNKFKIALEEYNTRKYRKSLWKSIYEYELFIEKIRCELKEISGIDLDKKQINDRFIEIIKNGSMEDVEDAYGFNKGDNSENVVYINPGKNGQVQKDFQEIFSQFGPNLVIKIYKTNFKDFSDLKLKFDNEIEDINNKNIIELRELDYIQKSNKSIPFIYYREEDAVNFSTKEKYTREQLIERIKNGLINNIENDYAKGNESIMNYTNNGKIIRDPVHGDIFIPEKYIKIIDTKVFQRLRRIKQLATEEYVYPQATHSRFAHSIGTFHIMRLIINHFCEIFQHLNIPVSNIEKDAILVAALLHDIGHGPLSHTFEKIIKKHHEEWTKEIIKCDNELNSILNNEFEEGFDDLVINYLDHFSANTPHSQNVENLKDVFSELISSQLDADRLDYLLRDSYNTGVNLAAIDLQKIIVSMEITRFNGANHLCINEDALSCVEQVIIGRYNMYDKIYHTPYKIFSEELFVKLLNHICNNKNIKNISKLLYNIKTNNISLKQYISLDDYSIFNEINHYIETTNDEFAQLMLSSLINRNGYQRIRVLDESKAAFNEFFNEIKYRTNIDVNLFEFCIIRAEKAYSAYNFENNNNEILISLRNGITKKMSDVSLIVKKDEKNKLLWPKIRSCLYINMDILRMEYSVQKLNKKLEFNKFYDVLTQLIFSYEIRNHMEIERKESCTQKKLNEMMLFLDKSIDNQPFLEGYKVIKKTDIDQFDIYYDTKNYDLAKNNFSFRCRDKKDGKYIWTIKNSDIDVNTNNNGQFIRSEFELESESNDIIDVNDFISKHIDLIQNNCECIKKLFCNKIFVKNHRVSYIVIRSNDNNNDFKCEISLDSIIYNDRNKDFQIEIELKSKYHIYQVELNSFVDALNEKIGIVQPNNEIESKYQKALKSIGIDFRK